MRRQRGRMSEHQIPASPGSISSQQSPPVQARRCPRPFDRGPCHRTRRDSQSISRGLRAAPDLRGLRTTRSRLSRAAPIRFTTARDPLQLRRSMVGRSLRVLAGGWAPGLAMMRGARGLAPITARLSRVWRVCCGVDDDCTSHMSRSVTRGHRCAPPVDVAEPRSRALLLARCDRIPQSPSLALSCTSLVSSCAWSCQSLVSAQTSRRSARWRVGRA